MVIYKTIKAFQEKGVYQIAKKTGLISPAVILKFEIFEAYNCLEATNNKEKIKTLSNYFNMDREYIRKAILFMKKN